jgi:hypothetical protein
LLFREVGPNPTLSPHPVTQKRHLFENTTFGSSKHPFINANGIIQLLQDAFFITRHQSKTATNIMVGVRRSGPSSIMTKTAATTMSCRRRRLMSAATMIVLSIVLMAFLSSPPPPPGSSWISIEADPSSKTDLRFRSSIFQRQTTIDDPVITTPPSPLLPFIAESQQLPPLLLPRDNDESSTATAVAADRALRAAVRDTRTLPPPLLLGRSSSTHHQSSNCGKNENVQRGLYHIAMGDIGGAAGTIFYQFVIAQILYAEAQGLVPFVHFSNVSYVVYDPLVHNPHNAAAAAGLTLTVQTGRNATYVKNVSGHRRDYTPGPPNGTLPVQTETLHWPGTGVWEHYFAPLVPNLSSCTKQNHPPYYVTMDLYLITPGLHSYSPDAPKCWRYKTLPDYIAQPHLGLTEWLAPQRRRAHDVVQRYFRPRPVLIDAAQTVNPHCQMPNRPCLGVHIRHSDKASGRRVIATDEFLPYVQAFLTAAAAATTTGTTNATPTMPTVYLATDSIQVLAHIRATWPTAVTSRLRTAGDTMLRSSTNAAVFDLDAGHHRTNVEAIVEILALSQCQFLLHGLSAMSEAAIWTNFDLHDTSVNLEDDEHLDPTQYQQLVQMVLNHMPKEHWPHPVSIGDIWPQLYDRSMRETLSVDRLEPPTNRACLGYDGLLLISKVGRDATAGRAFFSSVLKQLAYAERYNLKPWIHLEANDIANALLFDEQEHGAMATKQVQMKNSTISIAPNTSILVSNSSRSGGHDPTFRLLSANKPISRTFHGNGIWESYFLPVSDFLPGDLSCQDKPLVELDEAAIDLQGALDDQKLLRQQRSSAIVSKYYNFQPYILNRADQVNHPLEWDQPCLGVHLRNGDKSGKDRQKVSPTAFVPYIEAFANAGGKRVYVASDSHRAIQFLTNNLPSHLAELIQSQGVHVVRSGKLDWPLHMIDDHHRVNAELLVDIVALSRCVALLHSSSTTSDAVIYLNPDLIGMSVNLEEENPISVNVFEDLLRTRAFGSKTTR